MSEFKEFPKIFRYSRDVIVTEKLDGTNAAVVIEGGQLVSCQSRTKKITPQDDNYGFAAWAYTNGKFLAEKLGDGYHYGEWWGQGIQRKYDMTRKVFSLFNVSRWAEIATDSYSDAIGLCVVPVLWRGDMNDLNVAQIMANLELGGSVAGGGFKKPEGIVIYHTQGNFLLKKTFEKDVEGKNFEPRQTMVA